MNDRDEREEEKFNINESLNKTNRRTIELNDEDERQGVNNIDTKFTVTLKGINEKDFLLNKKTIEDDDDYKAVKRRLSDYEDYEEMMETNNNDDDDDDDDEESPAKRIKIRCVYWPSCEKADNCPYLHPNKQCE
jgi:hypothetical protein